MGIFDTILGLNSTGAQDAATAAATNDISSTGAWNNSILRSTTNRANDALTDAATKASSVLGSGYDAATGALTNYGGQAQDALRAGIDKAVGTVQGSNSNYSPYLSSGSGASSMLANALGLNGAGGNDAAHSAFTASPGYQWNVDQATDAAARKAASLGMSASGNTLDAITRLGSNLANNDYSSWLTNLSGLSGQGLTAANSVSSNNQSAGGYQYGGGGMLSQILSGLGSSLANTDIGKGTGLAGIDTNLGGSLSSNYTNLGQNVASNNMGVALNNANLGIADARAQDSASNANSGIFSKLLGGITGLPFGGSTSGSSGGGGLFGPTLSQIGTSIRNGL